jgi:hypothetical protein
MTAYTPSLVANTSYWWRVSASDGISVSDGPTWHFTTAGVASYPLYLPLMLR